MEQLFLTIDREEKYTISIKIRAKLRAYLMMCARQQSTAKRRKKISSWKIIGQDKQLFQAHEVENFR